MNLEISNFIDELSLEDKLEKMFFLLSGIVNEYYLPRDTMRLNPWDIIQYMGNEAEGDTLKAQEAKIAVEYNTIIMNADIARDYCLNLMNELADRREKHDTDQ